MSGFDDLRRRAEGVLGKGTTRRIEEELLRQAKAKQSDPGRREIVSAEKIRFEDRPTAEGFKAYSEVERAMQTEADLKKGDLVRPGQMIQPRDRPAQNGGTPSGPVTSSPSGGTPRADSYSARLLGQAIRHEYIYGMLGLVLGLASIIGGVVLCLNGVAGATSWTASLLGLETELNDAAPGVVLFIVGIFLVWATKPKVRLRDLQG